MEATGWELRAGGFPVPPQTIVIGDALLGVRVGNFTIERKIAEGGMGAVYVATHATLPIRKAVKVLLPDYSRHVQMRRRFEREAVAGAKLSHDNIVKVDDYGMLPDGQLWIMTEFLAGESLDAFLIRHGPLRESDALPMLLQLCSALDAAHAAGIVHRDIKPANVFVCSTGAVKLLDFGIAKVLGARDGLQTAGGSAVGTPAYMAIEQYEHANEASAQADIYALGILACEMVTGRNPWGRDGHRQRSMPPALDGLSPHWAETIQRALAVDPDARPRSAGAFAQALAENVSTAASGSFVRVSSPYAATIGADTLTAATAATEVIDPPSQMGAWRIALAGVAACAFAAAVTFAATQLRAHTVARLSMPMPDAGADAPLSDAPTR